MLNKENVVWWNEIEHDLYTENGQVFGVELDLFNGHQGYYCKRIEDDKECYKFLSADIYAAIEKFNLILEDLNGKENENESKN